MNLTILNLTYSNDSNKCIYLFSFSDLAEVITDKDFDKKYVDGQINILGWSKSIRGEMNYNLPEYIVSIALGEFYRDGDKNKAILNGIPRRHIEKLSVIDLSNSRTIFDYDHNRCELEPRMYQNVYGDLSISAVEEIPNSEISKTKEYVKSIFNIDGCCNLIGKKDMCKTAKAESHTNDLTIAAVNALKLIPVMYAYCGSQDDVRNGYIDEKSFKQYLEKCKHGNLEHRDQIFNIYDSPLSARCSAYHISHIQISEKYLYSNLYKSLETYNRYLTRENSEHENYCNCDSCECKKNNAHDKAFIMKRFPNYDTEYIGIIVRIGEDYREIYLNRVTVEDILQYVVNEGIVIKKIQTSGYDEDLTSISKPKLADYKVGIELNKLPDGCYTITSISATSVNKTNPDFISVKYRIPVRTLSRYDSGSGFILKKDFVDYLELCKRKPYLDRKLFKMYPLPSVESIPVLIDNDYLSIESKYLHSELKQLYFELDRQIKIKGYKLKWNSDYCDNDR